MFSCEVMVDITRQVKRPMLRLQICYYIPTPNEVQLTFHWDRDYNMSEEGGDGKRRVRPPYYDWQ